MNEWGKVKKVIVGIADKSQFCPPCPGNRHINWAEYSNDWQIPYGQFSQTIIDEANEDLENLANVYKQFGAEVIRPKFNDSVQNYQYLYCPRDFITKIHNKTIASPMSVNGRKDEIKSLNIQIDYNMSTQMFNDRDYNNDCIQNEGVLSTNNFKPMWDAANILRAGRDVWYLHSNTGNLLGAEQLQKILGFDFKVHVLSDVYALSHIDSTIAFLKPGVMLVNPARVQKEKLPENLQKWEIIEAPMYDEMEYYGDHPMMSKWCNLNLVSLDENTVVVNASQPTTIKFLEKLGYEVIPVMMRHQRTLGGGPHCCTSELEREYELDWYF